MNTRNWSLVSEMSMTMHPFVNVHLRRSQPHAGRRVHGLGHVADQACRTSACHGRDRELQPF